VKMVTLLIGFGCIIASYFYWGQATHLVLWSWQRADDLSFVKDSVSVAPLVATISVDKNGVRVQPRRNVLTLAQNAHIIPVIRLEIDPKTQVSDGHLDALIHNIQSLVYSCKTDIVQLDFDAAKSQRPLYEKLLIQLKASSPHVKVSITALASWCVGDTWIDKLPITHAVPMLYNLGENADDFKKYFTDNRGWQSKKCHGHIGFEQNDIFTKPPRGWHAYVFNKNAWTEKDYKSVQEKLR